MNLAVRLLTTRPTSLQLEKIEQAAIAGTEFGGVVHFINFAGKFQQLYVLSYDASLMLLFNAVIHVQGLSFISNRHPRRIKAIERGKCIEEISSLNPKNKRFCQLCCKLWLL
jgi:hypothetical protein